MDYTMRLRQLVVDLAGLLESGPCETEVEWYFKRNPGDWLQIQQCRDVLSSEEAA